MSPTASSSASVASGLAHVAALSFLAARLAPPLGFWVTLAGGVALARASQRCGMRQGYGASLAAVLEVLAIVGPARGGVSLTQALSAPLLGRLEGRGVGRAWQVLVCMAVRFAYHALAYAFFIWVILGGIEAYAGTYDSLLGRIPGLPDGPTAALGATAIGLAAWGVFASTVQVQVYARGLHRWPQDGQPGPQAPPAQASGAEARPFDPRAVALATLIGFAVLLAGTRTPVLAAAALWLGGAWLVTRAGASVLPATGVLALLLAVGAGAFTLLGGMGLTLALERASRAALLVLVAGWLRGAAGFAGLREVTRRSLGRLRRLPAVPEAVAVLDDLGTARVMGASAQGLVSSLRSVPPHPLPVVDAVLAWVSGEARRFRPSAAPQALGLRLRARDGALVASAFLPALGFLVG